MKSLNRDRIFTVAIYIIAILMTIAIIYPLWFIVIASFSDSSDVANGNVWLWPRSWHIDAYRELFGQEAIWRSYLNTIFYCATGTAFQLLVNIPAGYAMSRKELFGRRFWLIFFAIPMFVNGGLIPTYLTVRQFGLVDSWLVLIVPFSVSCYNIIVIRTFFKENIPEALWKRRRWTVVRCCATLLKSFFRSPKRFWRSSVCGWRWGSGIPGSMR